MITVLPIRTEARKEVLDRILDGRLGPLQRVNPTEIARDLGVSVTPLREALIELEQEGFLEARPNRGFVVAPFSVQELQDLYGLISTLEGSALRDDPPDAVQLDLLEQLNAELVDAAGDPWRVVQLDLEWHRILISHARNAILKDAIGRLKARAIRYIYAYLRDGARIPESAQQHRAIIGHLRHGQIEDAVHALAENWRPRVLLRWLREYRTMTASGLQ